MHITCPQKVSFRKQVIILSILDLLGGFVLLGLVIQAFYPALAYIWNVEIYWGYVVPFIFATGTFLVQSGLALVLFHGARKNKRVCCRVWIGTATLFLLLKSITVVSHLATGNHNHDGLSYALLIDCLGKVYQIVAVIAFMIRELNDDYEEHGKGAVLLFSKPEFNTLSI